jgi:uncharacterized membrane protein YagU involved in acid resistance
MDADFVRRGVVPGGIAGAIGGLALGLSQAELGVLPAGAAIVGSQSALVGFVVELLVSIVVGVGFGALVWRQQREVGEIVVWGLAYGVLWWFIGPLSVAPFLLRQPLPWTLAAAQGNLTSLFGLLLYGAALGLAFSAIQGREGPKTREVGVGKLVEGATAGLIGSALVGDLLAAQGRLGALGTIAPGSAPTTSWLFVLVVGAFLGSIFAALYPRPIDGAGPLLIRGVIFGFVWWVIGSLTVFPLLRGEGLSWSAVAARDEFAGFIAFVLFGAALALLYDWLAAAARLLFTDEVGRSHEGVGAAGLRAVGRGVVAGLVGGLLFTIVMVQVGFLPTVARLVGGNAPVTGFVVHLVISDLIGVSYAVLFRRQSYDVMSAVGWGTSYGLFWWFLGPLTLLPILLGASPTWSASEASYLFASLVGHALYGAGLGVTYYFLESSYKPWWIAQNEAAAARARLRRERLATSAPSLWALVVALALTLPAILAQ